MSSKFSEIKSYIDGDELNTFYFDEAKVKTRKTNISLVEKLPESKIRLVFFTLLCCTEKCCRNQQKLIAFF